MSSEPKPRPCKDCKALWEAAGKPPPVPSRMRPAPYSGPRCKEHHYDERDRRRKAAHERRVGDVYGLPPGAYDRLYEAQGRRCALCSATGRTKRLAVDHDHACCSGPKSCGQCVRGLICGPCNDTLAHVRDNPRRLTAIIDYLTDPPAKKVLRAYMPHLRQDSEGDG